MKSIEQYDHKAIEPKWQRKWLEEGIYITKEDPTKPKSYVLDMFPYPSGEGLHVGHPKGYIATDIYSRFKKMSGFNILHPMGWDAFGLPAENYALKHKIHPKIAVEKNIARFKEQLSILGLNTDWSREINTTDPKYYKWTQWIFLKLFEHGLAYQSFEPINWCPSCKTGLANEDLDGNRCERCGTIVEKKALRQWVLRITKYADRMLKDLDTLDWPASIKEAQRNWIGRSEGVNFKCKVKDLGIDVEMYNSVPQSFRAETFTVIAPEHPLIKELVAGLPEEKKVLEFVEDIKAKKAANKFDVEKDMEGIFTGRYIENFAGSGRDLPIWVASYVLYDYGTGIVNCSAHDTRDFAFAKKYDIPLHPVTFPEDPTEAEKVKNLEYAYARDTEGVMAEPAEFAGRKWGEARNDIIDFIVKHGWAERKVNYRLRDWIFSRQRYWGEPIPMIHCMDCGAVPVPESELPVVLPQVESYEPSGTGESPLANIDWWVNVKCPKCGKDARRETNTMPQWAGSSWYYLRYMDPHDEKSPVSSPREEYWAPVDYYVGGAEHATRHLIYARFWHKFLFDIGAVSTEEPFKKLQHVGLIAGPDGKKMSKRFGNVINPDDVVKQYGADTLRLYEMFIGPFDQGAAWSTESIIGPRRFLERVWRLQERVSGTPVVHDALTASLHRTIKKVSDDIENFRFNTAISSLMILANDAEKEERIDPLAWNALVRLLAPFAPHVSEEMWRALGHETSVHLASWPEYDSKQLIDATVTIVIQVNGKVRGSFKIETGATEVKVRNMALDMPEIKKWTEGKEPRKVVFVPDRLINIVL